MDAKNLLKTRHLTSLHKLACLESALLIIALFIGFCLANLQTSQSITMHFSHYLAVAVLYTGVTIFLFSASGLYNRSILVRAHEHVPRIILAMIIASLVLSEFSYLMPQVDIGVLAWGGVFLVSLLFIVGMRLIFASQFLDDSFKRKVLVLGAGRKALQFSNEVGKGTAGTTILGYIHQPGERELIEKDKLAYSVSALSEYAIKRNAEEIVLALDDRRNGFPIEQLLQCKLQGIEVTQLSDFYEKEFGEIKIKILDSSWLIGKEGFKKYNAYLKVKRLFDVLVSSALLTIFSPLFLISAMLLTLKNKGRQVLDRQRKLGLSNVSFNALAFKMPEKGLIAFFLKVARVEKLPRLMNILRGEMSFVGPSLGISQFEENKLLQPFKNECLLLKPGLFVWKGCGLTSGQCADAEQQLSTDLFYVKNCSFFLDFVILISQIVPVERVRGTLVFNRGLLTTS